MSHPPTIDMSDHQSTDRFTMPKASVILSKNGHQNRFGLPPDRSIIRVLAWSYEQQKELERSQQQSTTNTDTYNRRHAAAVSYENKMTTINNTVVGTAHSHPPHIHTTYYSDRVAHNMIWPQGANNSRGREEGEGKDGGGHHHQRHRPGVEAEYKRATRQAAKEQGEEMMRLALLEKHAREKERQAKVDEEEGRLMAEWPHGMMVGRMREARAGGMKRCVGVNVNNEEIR